MNDVQAAISDPELRLDPGLAGDPNTTDSRMLRLLGGFRIMVAAVLLSLFLIITDPRVVGSYEPALFGWTTFAYLSFAILAIVSGTWTKRVTPLHLYSQLLVDVLAVAILIIASGGASSGLGSLLFIPIGAAAVSLNRRVALLAAAIASMTILVGEFITRLIAGADVADFGAAGLLGAVLFVFAVAGNWLGTRMRESEALAQRRGVDIANLSQLNAYIVQHLRESIVVVDETGRIRLMNESAASFLGTMGSAAGRPLAEVSPELHDIWKKWLETPNQAREQPSFLSSDRSSVIIPHFAALGGAEETPPSLVFLEDSSLLAERVQQSKLASLGRLSASIAHEIRNPVGAISHAGQLLAESDKLGVAEQRLTEIIGNHSRRVNEIIENVLQLSRRDTTRPQRLRIADWLNGFCDEFARTLQLPPETISITNEDPDLEVRMDPSHLHQVLWNLCENAYKYGRVGDGVSMALHVGRIASTGRPYLEVADRGPGINQAHRDRIFEPFFAGAKEGTGLGLFIARELCECNRATLIYQENEGGGSIFRIIFADPLRWVA
ncbi:MAG: PAS domain-containing protein [Gammaproteobacteria bacterium]|nr:PAS domain-containing protein [Gammaproteobacteria bacterium]